MGIRTARIDALTFGLGSGIAGLAGVALSQIDNVSPDLGQGYIIDTFMVVVFGGVGNLWGTLVGALHARHRQQVPRAVRRRGARQDRRPGAHHPLHPEAPARPVRAQGPGGGGMIAAASLARRSTAAPIAARSRAAGAASSRRRARCSTCCVPAGSAVPPADLSAWRWSASIICYAHAGAGDRPDLGLLPASSRSATARSSRSAATPWACT